MDSLLRLHPAMISLLAGCQKLGLKSHVADELVHYLFVKRALLTGNEQTKQAARQLSPSVPMDQLWHWMLLNTSVRDAVHAMVGGDVPHSTDTADDPLPEKKRRRINAQEALKSFGFSVCEAAWGSPPMETLLDEQGAGPATAIVPVQQQHTQQQQQQADKPLSSTQPDQQQHQPGRQPLAAQQTNVQQAPATQAVPASKPAPAPAPCASPAQAAPAQAAPAQAKSEDQQPVMTIFIKDTNGFELSIRARPSLRVSRIAELVCNKFNMTRAQFNITFDGVQLSESWTLRACGIEREDTIDVLPVMTGC